MKHIKPKTVALSLLGGVALITPQIAHFQVMRVDTLEYVTPETGKTEEFVVKSSKIINVEAVLYTYDGASNNNLYITESRKKRGARRTINISLNGFYTPEEANAVKKKYKSEIKRIGGSTLYANAVPDTETPNKYVLKIVFRYPKNASEIDFNKFVDLYPPMLRSSMVSGMTYGKVHYPTREGAQADCDAFVEALKSEFAGCPEFEIVSTDVSPMQTAKGEYEYSVTYNSSGLCFDFEKQPNNRDIKSYSQSGFKTQVEADARRMQFEAEIKQVGTFSIIDASAITVEDINEPGTYFFDFLYQWVGDEKPAPHNN